MCYEFSSAASFLFFICSIFKHPYLSTFSPSRPCLSIYQRYSQVNLLCGYIRAILEFQKPRASFASFANKFVYRGIAAGLVPPVSLRQSRTLCPSLRRPRCSLSQLSVDGVRERAEGSDMTDRRQRTECRGADGGTEVTRNGVENVKICAEVHSKKKKGGRQSPPAG